MLSGIEAERIGGGGCFYGRIMEALQRGLPSAKRVEEAGTSFAIKTVDAADMLKLAQGWIWESKSIGLSERKWGLILMDFASEWSGRRGGDSGRDHIWDHQLGHHIGKIAYGRFARG